MRLLVVESITAGSGPWPVSPSLLAEAEALAQAMWRDALELPVQALLLRRADLPSLPEGVVRAVPEAAWVDVWSASLAWADAVWLLAPETDGRLERLAREAEAAGCRLLGPDAAAVARATRKSEVHRALEGQVAQPAWALGRRPDGPRCEHWVVKPDDGAGAEGVRKVADADLDAVLRESVLPPLVQEWIGGEPLSLSVLSDGAKATVLAANRQHLRWQGGAAHYEGGVANALLGRECFAPMAQSVTRSIPGLRGCFGIDLVRTGDGRDVFIELNPRLTTPFAHLREALGLNVGACLFDLLQTGAMPQVPAGRSVAFCVGAAA